MKVVVDTNIVFSAILNTDSKIGDLIINSQSIFDFKSVMYLKEEIEKHKERLVSISTLSPHSRPVKRKSRLILSFRGFARNLYHAGLA